MSDALAPVVRFHEDEEEEGFDPLPGLHLSDRGMARRLLSLHGHELRYDRSAGGWLVWDGARWCRDRWGQPAEWVYAMAEDMRPLHPWKEIKRWLGPAGVRGALAAAAPMVPVRPDELDADPLALNVANGTVDLATGVLGSHNPDALHSKITRGRYDPDAAAPAFRGCIETVLPDPEVRAYVQRLLGYSLLGEQREHVAVIFTGDGANGKSTVMAAVKHALGDYADSINGQLLTGIGSLRVPVEERNLAGLRLAVTNELEGRQRLDEAKVKRLTGGDTIRARKIGQDEVSFDPVHTLVILTNGLPDIRGTDHGIWRRLRVVDWPVRIERPDKTLPRRLEAEADGIMAWLVEGWHAYQVHGLAEPPSVTAAVSRLREDTDTIGAFLREATEPGGKINSTVLFTRWESWCAERREAPGTHTAFALKMTERGYVKRRGRADGSTGYLFEGLH